MITIAWCLGALEARWSAPAEPNQNRSRCRADAGEGVISASIAVLIMAFLGALMWFGFQQMWESTEQQTNDRVSQIGADAP